MRAKITKNSDNPIVNLSWKVSLTRKSGVNLFRSDSITDLSLKWLLFWRQHVLTCRQLFCFFCNTQQNWGIFAHFFWSCIVRTILSSTKYTQRCQVSWKHTDRVRLCPSLCWHTKTDHQIHECNALFFHIPEMRPLHEQVETPACHSSMSCIFTKTLFSFLFRCISGPISPLNPSGKSFSYIVYAKSLTRQKRLARFCVVWVDSSNIYPQNI